MSNSPLATSSVNLTKNSNARKNLIFNPSGTIKGITIHHMAGKMSGKACAEMHAKKNASSANYYIGYTGDICLGVTEDRRAWTTGDRKNDYNYITIEVSNDQIGGNWHVSDTTILSLIKLCVDICKRNGITKVWYDGTKNAPLNAHFMFQSTACPANYVKQLQNSGYISSRINEGLSGVVNNNSTNPSSNTSNSTTKKNPYKEPTVEVKYGAKSDQVGWIQWQLSMIFGYNILIDKAYGPATQSAINDFQKRNGLTQTTNCPMSTVNNLKREASVGANGVQKISLVYKGVDYTNVFNAQYYADNYKDLRDAFGYDSKKLFDHFVNNGMSEMRQAIKTFNVQKYASNYSDLRNAFGPLSTTNAQKYYQHYCEFGKKENRIAI